MKLKAQCFSLSKFTAVAFTFFFAPMSLLAESRPTYVLGVSVGLRDVDFELDSIGSPSFIIFDDDPEMIYPAGTGSKQGFEFDESLYTAGFSGTLIYERMHISALLEIPIQTENTGLHTSIEPNAGTGTPITDSSVRASELDRIDFNLSLGYRVWEGLSVFSGYKYTEFDLESQERSLLMSDKDQNYVEEGFFIGSSYNWKFGATGTLSVSLAYAYLDAEFSEGNIDREPPPFGFSYEEFAYSGSANGLSYGVQWSGRVTGQWLYSVGFKYQKYESDDNSTSLQQLIGDYAITQDPDAPLPATITPISITDIDTKHTDIAYSIGLSYIFSK